MERPELKLVRDDPSRAGRAGAIAEVLLALGAGALATALGADAARAPSRAARLAAEAARAALERGPTDPGARGTLVELRRMVGERPRDAATRAIYAAALLDVAGESPDAREAAAFHAARAAADAPVTVPVVAAAARTLARAGRAAEAVPLVRSMFAYDAPAAALLLEEVGAYHPGSEAQAVPDLPAAWTAWGLSLRRAGRFEEGTRRIEGAAARWPEDVDARRLAGLVAAGEGRWDDLERLLAGAPEHPTLLALRARLEAHRGDRERAIASARSAEALSEGDAGVREIAGRALLDAGDVAGARAMWERALWSLPTTEGARAARLRLAVSLARLERDHGRAGDALRAWRRVLEIDPSNAEARK